MVKRSAPMDKEKLRLVILDQRKSIEEQFERKNIIRRDLSSKVNIEHPTALVILGVRRSGKSTLSRQLFLGDTFGYINFDDERLIGLTTEDLNAVLQVFYELYGSNLENIILDEIQLVQHWEPFVSRLRDTKKIVVTGSSSNLLSGELSTRLTGRHIDRILFPFSFREYLLYKKVDVPSFPSTGERADLISHLNDYLVNGGFPERLTFGNEIIKNIYEDIIVKDVSYRHRIRNASDLRQIARFLVTNSGNEFGYASLKDLTKVKSVLTLTKWTRYLEEAYLIFVVERFSFKLKETVKSPKKAYCIDNGLITEIGREFPRNVGRLMENLVAIELMRRSKSPDNFQVSYWKGRTGKEVDFVSRRNGRVEQLIQVTFASSLESVNKKEIDALIEASSELRCDNLLVITWDYDSSIRIDNKMIHIVSLWKWLLNFPVARDESERESL